MSQLPTPPAFISEHLPDVLLSQGPRGLAWWQWLGVALLVVMAWIAGRALSWVSAGLLRHLTTRTKATWDDLLLARLSAPLTLAWMLVLAAAGFHFLAIPDASQPLFEHALRVGFFLVFFWCLSRSVDVLAQVAGGSRWALERPSSRSLLPLASRVVKVALVAIGVVAIISELGYPVASLIAGLGIGGLAVALAAQKTVENLFGAFSLGVDQPIREGDFVRVEDFTGTVETIGLRSTRFRTLDRTLITIPNGKLAEMRLESFAPRDRHRFFCLLALSYGTPVATLRNVLASLEADLRAAPKAMSDGLSVRLVKLGESSLDIEVAAWFQTADANEFSVIRQDLLLTFLTTVEQAGASLAFPTRTVHLAGSSSAIK